jgi:hypothetical protein
MACHCEPGAFQPGEAISYHAWGLPRREKAAARSDIADFKKALFLLSAFYSLFSGY